MQLMRWSWIACITATGSKPGSTRKVPPSIRVGMNSAPPAWVSGAQASTCGGLGHSQSVSISCSVVIAVRWQLGSALGLPVVPPE